MVLCDKDSGRFALLHHDSVVHQNKFGVSLKPKILCIPKIFEEDKEDKGTLIDYCIVRSPAQYILSTSKNLLVTLHGEKNQLLRLWSTEDGRCIMTSPSNILEGRNIRKILQLQDNLHPGVILCFCRSDDILIINTYTMSIIGEINSDFKEIFQVQRSMNNNSYKIRLLDKNGSIYIWNNYEATQKGSQKSARINKQLKQCSPLLLGHCNESIIAQKKNYETLKFEQSEIINLDQDPHIKINFSRGVHRDMLVFFSLAAGFIIVYQDRIEYADSQQARKVLFQYEEEEIRSYGNQKKQNWFIFAKLMENDTLICVDNDLNLILFDDQFQPIKKLNLINDAKLFNLKEKFVDQKTGLTLLQSQEDLMRENIEEIKKRIEQSEINFKSADDMIYLIGQNPKIPELVSWSLKWFLDGSNRQSIPMYQNVISIFDTHKKDPFCHMNISPAVIKSQFSSYQHSFFFADERITNQTFYIASDYPSQIIGTSFGRIFIQQLFQDIEGRAFPIIVIDSHNGSPITCLYMAYSSARKGKQSNFHNNLDERSSSITMAQNMSLESGGHLIACSEDGTISVTNMNNGEMISQLNEFSVSKDETQLRRANNFLKQRENNFHQKRRQSFSENVNFQKYFNLVRIKPMKVFDSCSFCGITRVVEVQVLQMQQLQRQKYLQQFEGQIRQAQRQRDKEAPHETVDTSNMTAKSDSADHARETNFEKGSNFSSRASHNHYTGHLQSIQAMSLTESLTSPQQSPLLNELMPFKSSYACLDLNQNAVYILSIQNHIIDMMKINGLDSAPIGVYEDVLSNNVHVITNKDLNVYSYNKRSKMLVRKSNFAFAQSALQINQTIQTLTEKQQHFKQAQLLTDGQKYEQYSFAQQFQEKSSSMQASGHKVLDYLSLSLSLPLYYHPHSFFSQKFTKTMQDLLPYRDSFRHCILRPQDQEFVKKSMRVLIENEFAWNDRYKSDFNQEFYQAQGAVTPIVTGGTSNQQVIIINTKDMISVFKARMKALSDSLARPNTQYSNQGDGEQEDDNKYVQPSISAEYFQNNKWPTRLLALVHPFSLDENLDENLELFFGLSNPYSDFRIGIQGTGEAFSFMISRDNQEFEPVKYLKLSKINKEVYNQLEVSQKHLFVNSEYWKASTYLTSVMSSFFLSTLVSIVEFAQPDITTLMQDWLNAVQYITSQNSNQKQSQKINRDLEIEIQDYHMFDPQSMPLSVTALSQLMLRKDHSLSSCARDVIMKPLLSSGSSVKQIKAEIDEWQDLIMDTYLKLKEDSSMRQAYNGQALENVTKSSRQHQQMGNEQIRQQSQIPQNQLQENQQQDSQKQRQGQLKSGEFKVSPKRQIEEQKPEESKSAPANDQRIQPFDRSIHHFFGELEIRGLINLSYYSLYSQDGPQAFRIDSDVQNRLCKCTVILTREIMAKFTVKSKEYQGLLTILMQLLQTQMRAQVPTFKTKVIKEDVIKILLLIYDFYKKQLRDERFLTRVVAENFHLIHPKNSELYLKLTAAKTLLEIGTYFTEDFLQLINDQATTLKDGPDYQRNVLDVLRYFINGSRDGLEPYLIQIVKTLLKCLDPNDEQLRKNSTQLISIILSTMVKSFPMIAFHHETQRLAVGTPQGPIAIYDVRTSARWKILEGHNHNINCVEFDQRGNILVSYSAKENSLRLWKVSNTGFFTTLIGTQGKSLKEISLKPLQKKQIAKVEKKKQQPDQRCKIRFSYNEKEVELTREDGSIELIKISK